MVVKERPASAPLAFPHPQDPNAKRGYRLVGDVEFEGAKERAAHITPVPGGVGPVRCAARLASPRWATALRG